MDDHVPRSAAIGEADYSVGRGRGLPFSAEMERNFTVGFGSRRGLLRGAETAMRLGGSNAKQRPRVRSARGK